MKRTFMGMLAVMAVALVPGARAIAEDITFASHSEIMSVLERQNARIAELEHTLHNGGGCSSCGGHGDSCGDCCGDSCGCCDPCCRPSGVIGGAEITFLKVHTALGVGVESDYDFDYEASPRLWAGYQGSDGLGWRVRYWEFDHQQANALAGGRTDIFAYDTYLFDIEFVDSMSLGCYWDATISAGFRYMDFNVAYLTTDATGAVEANSQVYSNNSIGLTLGGELRRCIGNGLAGFVNTRASVMMGDEDEYRTLTVAAPFTLFDTELDNIYYIWEAQAGVQWTRELQDCGYLFARAAVEVQIWDNVAGSGPITDINGRGTEDFGLGGAAFSAGIIR
jgi:hypothetical protein